MLTTITHEKMRKVYRFFQLLSSSYSNIVLVADFAFDSLAKYMRTPLRA